MSSTLSFVGHEPFFDVPRTSVSTSLGPVQLPILYRRTRNVNAFFLVDVDKVQAVLQPRVGDALQAACRWRGKTMVGLACYEYQDTSIGPYHEIGLAVAVVPRGVTPRLGHWLQALGDVDKPARELGFYVLHLPVSTAEACTAGREIWGLPKFITPMQYERAGQGVKVVLCDPDRPTQPGAALLTLEGELGASMPGPSMGLVLYSQDHRQQWLRTAVNVRGGQRVHAPGSMRLHVGHSPHPMVQTLTQLGLRDAQPLCVTDTDTFQSRLNEGRPVRI